MFVCSDCGRCLSCDCHSVRINVVAIFVIYFLIYADKAGLFRGSCGRSVRSSDCVCHKHEAKAKHESHEELVANAMYLGPV